MIRLLAAMIVAGSPVVADSLTTTRPVRPTTILTAADLAVLKAHVPGTLTTQVDIVGQEARVILYPGRPIRPGDVGPPALVDRNQRVELVYKTPTLKIRTEGRALDRGAVGDRIRVMNLGSRTTISGVVSEAGHVVVSPFGGQS